MCYRATGELGISQSWLSQKLGIYKPANSLVVARGGTQVAEKNYTIENLSFGGPQLASIREFEGDVQWITGYWARDDDRGDSI